MTSDKFAEFMAQEPVKEECRRLLQERDAEIERLRAALRHIQEVAEAAAMGRENVDHWWYGEEVHRVLDKST